MKPSVQRLFVAVCGLMLLAGCDDRDWKAQVNHTWPAAGIHELNLETVRGRVRIVGGEGDRISLTARIRGSGSRRKDDSPLKIENSGGVLSISEKGSGGKRFGLFRIGRGRARGVQYELRVPSRLNVEITTVSGAIDSSGIEGTTSLRTVNGAIQATTRQAELKGSTVNGSIKANFLERFRGAQFKTVNGSITVTVPSDSSIACDVVQVNGNFHSDLPVALKSVSRGETSAEVGSGEFPLQVSTVNGSVRLRQRD